MLPSHSSCLTLNVKRAAVNFCDAGVMYRHSFLSKVGESAQNRSDYRTGYSPRNPLRSVERVESAIPDTNPRLRTRLRQRRQDDIGPLHHANFGQNNELVPERWISFEKPRILGESRVEVVAALQVGHVNLRPRGC